MKKIIISISIALAAAGFTPPASAQFDLGHALQAGIQGIQAMTLSDEQVAEYARQSVKQMDAENTVAPDNDPYTRRLRSITAAFKSADGLPLNFKVYKTSDVNAFACPDGSVRVFSGLMDMMDDDELLGVIGHEIGHVEKHHSRKQMKQQLLQGAFVEAISSAGGQLATLSQSQLSQLGQALASAKYSKKQEEEADDCGYDFLRRNGKNPWGMVSAFEKMSAMEKASGAQYSYLQKMFSDHPDTDKRIKSMKKRCKKDGITEPTAAELKAAQAMNQEYYNRGGDNKSKSSVTTSSKSSNKSGTKSSSSKKKPSKRK